MYMGVLSIVYIFIIFLFIKLSISLILEMKRVKRRKLKKKIYSKRGKRMNFCFILENFPILNY